MKNTLIDNTENRLNQDIEGEESPFGIYLRELKDFHDNNPERYSFIKTVELDPEVEHSERGQSSVLITRGNATKLIVKFPDGTVIAEPKATETFR